MAKKVDSFLKGIEKMDSEERKCLIDKREQKNIFIQEQLQDKAVIYHEYEFKEDGTVDIIFYLITKGEDLTDMGTVIYIDRYSNRKRRERCAREAKLRRRRA